MNVQPDPFAAANSPRRKPLSYPGHWPKYSALISRTHLWELLDRNGRSLGWDETAPQRLSACRVRLDEQSVERLGLSHAISPFLMNVLEESEVVGVDARIPVLAIGSNGAPSQLRHKFEALSVQLLVPSVRARLAGAQVGFGAFIAPGGYVPATIFPDADQECELTIQWLDAGQLREIDATESARYRRVWLDESVGVNILLETGERLPGAYAYVAEVGMLGADGTPWVMAAPSASRPAALDESRWIPDQTALIARLQSSPVVREALGSTPEEFLDRRHGFDDYGMAVLAGSGFHVASNPFAELPDEQGAPPRQYGALLPEAPRDVEGGAVHAIVSRSPDNVERAAQSVVRLDPELYERLGRPRHVQVASTALVREHGDAAPRALAVVLPERPGDAPVPARGSGVAQVDHVLRMAAGIVVGEPCELTAVTVRRQRWPDFLLGRPNYLTMRVTLADPSSAERDVSLMSALSLQLLGVSSGDHVVIEGEPDEHGDVASVTIKAFETPDSVAEERDRVTGGTWGARFPGTRESLGVHPDIPRIFIDSATRSRLGIGRQQLGTVRVRPARRQQFSNELREIMLVLAIALIGIIGMFTPDSSVGLWILVAIVVVTLGLTLGRMRRRLAHNLDRGRSTRRRR